MGLKVKICTCCGELFQPETHNQRFCKKNDCYRKDNIAKSALRREKERAKRQRFYRFGNDINEKLTEEAFTARAYGMSYGHYKGLQWQNENWGKC